MNIEISVIICTYNRDLYIEESIRSVLNQNHTGINYELVLVNNNSTDKTDSICTTIFQSNSIIPIQYYIETQQGLSAARNRGIALAKGEIIVFIDDDAMMFPDFIAQLSNAYKQHPEMAASGGRIYPRFESKAPNWMSRFLIPLMSVIDKGEHPKPFKGAAYPIGANMAFRKSVIDQIGLFDTALGRSGKNLQGGEEKDIFNRIKARNLSIIYLPFVRVYHIIPDARLTADYIRKMGVGIGSSERIRSKNIHTFEYLKTCAKEIAKWVASIGLFCWYSLILSPQKGIMILRFRAWVSSGVFSKNKTS